MAEISRWGCNEGSGLTARDSISGRDLTLTNGPTWGPGTIVYDGVNDYSIRSSVNLGFNGLTECSIAFRISTSDTAGRIIAKEIADGINTFRVTKDTVGVPIIFVEFDNDTLAQYPSWYCTYPSDTLLHNVVVTFKTNAFDATDCKIYIDTVDTATTFAANGYASGFTLEEISSNLVVGVRAVSFTDPLAGYIGDMRIFNTQLTSGQVAALSSALTQKQTIINQAVKRASYW